MLNELRNLSRSLLADGIQFTDWHPNFDKCPKARITCFIYITEEGNISDISLPEPDFDVTTIRKWERANGCSFPAFNVPPLFGTVNDILSKEINLFKKSLQKGKTIESKKINDLISNCRINWNNTAFQKINLCFSRAISEIEEQLGEIPLEYSAIKKLLEIAKKLDAEGFHKKLTQQIIQRLDGSINSKLIDILFQTGNQAKLFQLIFEIKDWATTGARYPANHPAVQKWLNDKLMDFSAGKRVEGDIVKKDAFDANSIGYEEKLPSVRIPKLGGDVILRAMNSESPCQYRYGMADAFSFPVGAEVRKEMKGALEWLSDEALRGKTWIDLTRGKDNRSVLFAYPTKKPKTAPELAGLIGGTDNTADFDEATFSAIAARVVEALKGISSITDNDVEIFVLAKRTGDARTKVVVSKRYTTDHMIESAEKWQKGCRNIPNIRIRGFAENDSRVWRECLVPFPAEVVWCLNTSWKRQGTYAESIHGFSISDALNLLLDMGVEVEKLSHRAMDAIVKNCATLILAVGQANTCDRTLKIDKKYEKQILLLPSTLGLLLHKNRIEKGGFMSSPAFLVGRLLSLVDDLHMKYCQGVRRGKLPTQLIGNALMKTALETPARALNMLSQRILPYQAWAKTLSGDKEDILEQIGKISKQLKEEALPSTCSDIEKAQMLLGYLARSENN